MKQLNSSNDKVEIPEEFNDFIKVIDFGAEKYEPNNWLQPDGKKSGFQQMHISAIHHLIQSYSSRESLGSTLTDKDYYELMDAVECGYDRGIKDGREDNESGLDSILHAICRTQMIYTKLIRGQYNGKRNQ